MSSNPFINLLLPKNPYGGSNTYSSGGAPYVEFGTDKEVVTVDGIPYARVDTMIEKYEALNRDMERIKDILIPYEYKRPPFDEAKKIILRYLSNLKKDGVRDISIPEIALDLRIDAAIIEDVFDAFEKDGYVIQCDEDE